MAAQLGYCGLDRQRLPLRGDEIRACWEGRAGAAPDDVGAPPIPVQRLRPAVDPPDDRTTVRRLEFVPVGEPPPPAPRRRVPKVQPTVAPPTTASGDPGWSLWGDLEP